MEKAKGKRGRQSKHWCYTLYDLSYVPDWDLLEYNIWNLETCPTTGKKHLQGYCVFKKRCYITGAKKAWASTPPIHIDIKGGTVEQAIHYCKKPVDKPKACYCAHCEDARQQGQVADWMEYGTRPKTKEEAISLNWKEARDLAMAGKVDEIPNSSIYIRYYAALKRVEKDHPIVPKDLTDKDNYWIVAPSHYGKSYYARHTWPDFYDKAPNKWWTGYSGQKTVLLDDLGPEHLKYLGWYIKRWADEYSYPMETKGGGRQIRPQHIVVTSQSTIAECCGEDEKLREALTNRFKVVNLPLLAPKEKGPKRMRNMFRDVDLVRKEASNAQLASMNVDYPFKKPYKKRKVGGDKGYKGCCHRQNWCHANHGGVRDFGFCDMFNHVHRGEKEEPKDKGRYKAFMEDRVFK